MDGDKRQDGATKNTIDLDRRLANSQLVIYPDAGHGGVFRFSRTSSSGLSSSSERGTLMKAFVVEQYGKDGLRAAEVPEPEIGDGDVLVKVSAPSINPLDTMVRDGEFKRLLKYRTPFVLGRDVAPKPASLTLHEAAAVPLVSLAAWQALVDRSNVQPDQKVLVHAGSGGLGSTVIQLAKHLGATVATTARGENAELVRSLGADVVVNYT